jgi:hypothetical protein
VLFADDPRGLQQEFHPILRDGIEMDFPIHLQRLERSFSAYARSCPGVRIVMEIPHVQQLFLHEKLFREDRCFGQKSLIKVFMLYMKLLFTLKTLPLYKKPIIAAWSFAVLLLPKLVAEP